MSGRGSGHAEPAGQRAGIVDTGFNRLDIPFALRPDDTASIHRELEWYSPRRKGTTGERCKPSPVWGNGLAVFGHDPAMGPLR